MKRQLLLIGCLILMFDFSLAQTTPGIEWAKCFGGSNDDQARSIIQTNDGGFVVAGFSNSNDSNVTGNHGGPDYWVIKLDNAGNLQWQKSYGGTNGDYGQSVYQTFDQGYIVAGYTTSNDGDVSGNNGYEDFWIIKIDSMGFLQWQKCLGGTKPDMAHYVIQTNDSGYIIAGGTLSNDGDVSGNHDTIAPLMNDYWIVKLDNNGNIQWQKCFGGSEDDQAFSIRHTTDGGYVVAGWTQSNDGDVSGIHSILKDKWIIKIDSVGNLQWQKCLGGTDEDRCYSAQQTNDGGFITSGAVKSNDGDVSGNHGGLTDVWITKLDSINNLEWQVCLGGTGFEEGYSIQQTTDSGFIIGCVSYSNDGNVSGNHGGDDYWIVKLDTTANIQWQKSFGGSDLDWPYSIRQTNDGGYIIAGHSGSNDGDVSGNNGTYDYWIVKLFPDTITGIIQHPNQTSSIQTSPNPFTTTLTLKGTTQKGELTIFDITGKEILRTKTFGAETTINTAHLTPGFYFINYREGDKTVNKKVVKM
ncbi:MAG: T9SS type A sorting domain-containing protein [Bacteroidia bacterium]